MNNRLVLNLINRRHRPHQGFALVFSLGLGLVILVISAAMLIRGQEDQTKVVSQQAKNAANAAAETGVARLQAFLTVNPILAKYSMEEWEKMVKTPGEPSTYTDGEGNFLTWGELLDQAVEEVKGQSCEYVNETNANVKTALSSQIRTIVGSTNTLGTVSSVELPNPSGGSNAVSTYQIKKYRFNPDGTAKVLISGDFGNGKAKSSLVASFPVSGDSGSTPTSAFPGLWVKEAIQNTGKVNANVAYDCSMNPGTINSVAGNDNDPDDKKAGYTIKTSTNTTGTPPAPVISLALKDGYTIQSSSMPMPDAPDIPSTGIVSLSFADIPTQTVASVPNQNGQMAALLVPIEILKSFHNSILIPIQHSIEIAQNFWVGMPALAKKDSTDDTTKTNNGGGNDNGGGQNAAIRTLPRQADIDSGDNLVDGEYRYVLDTITDDLNINPNYKVTIYLTGDIDLQGGKKRIKYDCTTSSREDCDATDAKIIGKKANGNLHLGGNPSICDIFFWAPTYNVTINGGGQAQGCGGGANNNGIYWVKSWGVGNGNAGGGQGNHIALEQSGSDWNQVKQVVNLPVRNKLGNISQWSMMDEVAANNQFNP